MRTSLSLAHIPSLHDRCLLLDAIRREAALQGMSMADLARKADLPPETVSRIPNRKDVGYDTLWRLAAALGFSVGLVTPVQSDVPGGVPLFDTDAFPGIKG